MKKLIFLTLFFLMNSFNVFAIEVEKRISDKEIIERLISLEEGQKNLSKRIDDLSISLNKRIDDLSVSLNKRIDDVNKRIDDLMTLLQILIGVLAVVAAGIFGVLLTMWRRITALEPLKEYYLKLQDQITEIIKSLKPPRDVL